MGKKGPEIPETSFVNSNENVVGSHNNVFFIKIGGSGLLLLAVVFIFVWQVLPKLKTQKMTGDFRVAVVGFSVMGETTEKDLGIEVANVIASHLNESLKQVAATLDPVVPYINVEVWGPDKTGKVSGESAEKRASEAYEIAEKIEAHMVIYGFVDVSQPMWQIMPEFFISDKSFFDAQELLDNSMLSGQYSFGEPILIPSMSNPVRQMELTSQVSKRARVLSIVTASLSYYSVHYYDAAIEILRTIEDDELWKNDQGGESDTKKLFYLLLGNAESLSNQFEEAETHYQSALDLDANYSRALIGKGNMTYIKALQTSRQTENYADIDIDLLNQSIDWFQKASASGDKPPLADIETKVHFGVGQCLLAKVLAKSETYFDPAIYEFQAVIEDYDDGKNYRVKSIAAEAHARLGLIYEISGDLDAAKKEYEQAVLLLADNPERRSVFLKSLDRLK